jgi:hypothetical protein
MMFTVGYTTRIITPPPPLPHPLFRDHTYKGPFMGGTVGSGLGKVSLYTYIHTDTHTDVCEGALRLVTWWYLNIVTSL